MISAGFPVPFRDSRRKLRGTRTSMRPIQVGYPLPTIRKRRLASTKWLRPSTRAFPLDNVSDLELLVFTARLFVIHPLTGVAESELWRVAETPVRVSAIDTRRQRLGATKQAE